MYGQPFKNDRFVMTLLHPANTSIHGTANYRTTCSQLVETNLPDTIIPNIAAIEPTQLEMDRSSAAIKTVSI